MHEVKILLIDKDPVTSSALEVLLDDDERLLVAGSARSEEEGLQLLEERRIDVVLLDVNVNNKTFYRPLQRLRRRFPHQKVLALLYEESEVIDRLKEIGAEGFFYKNRDLGELPDALWKVQEEGFFLPEEGSPVVPEPEGVLSFKHSSSSFFGAS